MAHRSRKIQRNVKYHLSMSSKLGFRVPRWNRNDTFLREFVKSLLFFASHRASAVGNVARDGSTTLELVTFERKSFERTLLSECYLSETRWVKSRNHVT